MLDRLHTMVTASYSAKEARGVFISVFDRSGQLLVSQGVIETNKPLGKTLETLYHAFVQPHIDVLGDVVVDVVTGLYQEHDTQKLLALSMKENGIFVSHTENEKSALVLPYTAGVQSMSQALQLVQSKYGLGGNVLIYVFSTERFLCSYADT